MSISKQLCRTSARSLQQASQRRCASSNNGSARVAAIDDIMREIPRATEQMKRRPRETATSSLLAASERQAEARSAPSPARRGPSIESMAEKRARERREEEQLEMEQEFSRQDLERQAVRQWRVGDVYAPHDLTGVEARKWQKPARKEWKNVDILDRLGIDPLKEYKNFSLMADFVSEAGRIKSAKETGLRPVNQRRMARAVRRAVGLGLMPRTYQHPELIQRKGSFKGY